MNIVPEVARLTVQLYDENWHLLAEVQTTIKGETGSAGNFSGQIAVQDYSGLAILVVSHETDASYITRITIQAP